MSMRDASRFNLRAILEEETKAEPLTLSHAPPPHLSNQDARVLAAERRAAVAMGSGPSASAPRAQASKLSFDLSALQPKAAPEPRRAPPAAPQFLSAHHQLSLKGAVAQSAHRETSQADVMRLTGVAEDLRNRLSRATERAQDFEAKCNELNAALGSFKASTSERVQSMSTQLAESRQREIEAKRGVAEMERKQKQTRLSLQTAVYEANAAREDLKKAEQTKLDLNAALREIDQLRLNIEQAESAHAETKRFLVEKSCQHDTLQEELTYIKETSKAPAEAPLEAPVAPLAPLEAPVGASVAPEKAFAALAERPADASAEEARARLARATVEAAQVIERAEADAARIRQDAVAFKDAAERARTEAERARAEAEKLKATEVVSLEQRRENEEDRVALRKSFFEARQELLDAARDHAIACKKQEPSDIIEHKLDVVRAKRAKAMDMKLRHDIIFGSKMHESLEESLEESKKLYERVLGSAAHLFIRKKQEMAETGAGSLKAVGQAPAWPAPEVSAAALQHARDPVLRHGCYPRVCNVSIPAACDVGAGDARGAEDPTGDTMVEAIVTDISNFLKKGRLEARVEKAVEVASQRAG